MGDNSSSIAERRQPIFTMATSPNRYVKLAQQLPPRLSRFFARYPPQAIVSSSALSKASSPCTPAADSSASSADHISTGQDGLTVPSPFSVKSTEERLRRREENGLRVKGTGIGQRVKGRESERTLKGRLEKRRQAMLEMPQMIQTWKERGHGRGWKKWPK